MKRRNEVGSLRIVFAVVISFVFLLISTVIVMGGFMASSAEALPAASGSCASITVSPDDLNKVTNDPSLSADGGSLYHAPTTAVEAYVCAQALIHDRLKDQPRLAGCQIRWQMTAAIGTFETGNGTNSDNVPHVVDGTKIYFDPDGNTWDPIRSDIGAMGPMQFTPLTWDANQSSISNKYDVDANGDGTKSADNMYDSALGAAALLCDRTPADYSSSTSATYDQVFHALQNYCAPTNPEQYTDCQTANIMKRVDLVRVLDSVSIGYTLTAPPEGDGTCTIGGTVSDNMKKVIDYACSQIGSPYVGLGAGETFHFPQSYQAIDPNSEWGPASQRLLAAANTDAAFRANLQALDGVKLQWDCSGLTMMSYRLAGVNLPHQSEQQHNFAHAVKVSDADLQPGDLVFFSGHVGMFIGNDQFVEAGHTPQDQGGSIANGLVKVSTYSSRSGHLGGARYLDASGNPL